MCHVQLLHQDGRIGLRERRQPKKLIKADNSLNIETEKKQKRKKKKKQTNKQKRRLVFFSFGDMKGWLDGLPERERER